MTKPSGIGAWFGPERKRAWREKAGLARQFAPLFLQKPPPPPEEVRTMDASHVDVHLVIGLAAVAVLAIVAVTALAPRARVAAPLILVALQKAKLLD